MTLEELLKLKQEDYEKFKQITQELNSELPKYLSVSKHKLSVAIMGVMNKGRIQDENTRKKRSESHLGKTSPNKGKVLSSETKEKISKSKLKPYAIYKGKTYTAIGLSEELGFKHYTKVSQIKSGKKKDEWGITFL